MLQHLVKQVPVARNILLYTKATYLDLHEEYLRNKLTNTEPSLLWHLIPGWSALSSFDSLIREWKHLSPTDKASGIFITVGFALLTPAEIVGLGYVGKALTRSITRGVASRSGLPKGWRIIDESENRISIISETNSNLAIEARLDQNGVLRYRIEVEPKGQGIGSQLHDAVMKKFEGRVTAIEESWIPTLPDNLNTFNARIAHHKATGMPENLAEIQAARDTFGGKMAGKNKFTEAEFMDGTRLDPATGLYTNVQIRFSKPSK